MEKRVYNFLEKYINKNPIRLHMPGHKGRGDFDFYKYDITELSFSDNLANPKGDILKLKEDISKIYKSKESIILSGGSSSGIVASLLSTLKEDDEVLLFKNSHISAYNGILLARARPVFIKAGKTEEKGIIEAILEAVNSKNSNIKVVFLTYPDYFGIGFDIQALIKILKKKGILVIVDQAHGAHLTFCDELPICSVEAGADIVIMSVHKTLGAINPSAIIHINTEKIDISKIKLYLSTVQTTSPSYLMIMSMEESLIKAKKEGADTFKNIKIWYNNFRKKLKDNTCFFLKSSNEKYFDYLKISISTENTTLTGYEVSDILRKDYGIYLEYACKDSILAYLGINSLKSDLDKFYFALSEISNKYIDIKKEKTASEKEVFPQEEDILSLSMKEAVDKNFSYVDISDSLEKVSGGFVISYPPGYPILIPGQVITKNKVEYLNKIINTHEIIGLKERYVKIVEE